MQQSWKIAFALHRCYCRQDSRVDKIFYKYFISFGQIGLIGVLLLGLLNAAFGKNHAFFGELLSCRQS